MKYIKSILLLALFFILSCTDGIQVGQKINQLIKEAKVTVIVIKNNNPADSKLSKKYKIEEVKIDNQFLEVNDTYLNLEKVKSLNVLEKELTISF